MADEQRRSEWPLLRTYSPHAQSVHFHRASHSTTCLTLTSNRFLILWLLALLSGHGLLWHLLLLLHQLLVVFLLPSSLVRLLHFLLFEPLVKGYEYLVDVHVVDIDDQLLLAKQGLPDPEDQFDIMAVDLSVGRHLVYALKAAQFNFLLAQHVDNLQLGLLLELDEDAQSLELGDCLVWKGDEAPVLASFEDVFDVHLVLQRDLGRFNVDDEVDVPAASIEQSSLRRNFDLQLIALQTVVDLWLLLLVLLELIDGHWAPRILHVGFEPLCFLLQHLKLLACVFQLGLEILALRAELFRLHHLLLFDVVYFN